MNSDERSDLIRLLRSMPYLSDADVEAGTFELDSLQLLQLVEELEKAYGIDFSTLDVEPEELRNLDRLTALLDRFQAARE